MIMIIAMVGAVMMMVLFGPSDEFEKWAMNQIEALFVTIILRVEIRECLNMHFECNKYRVGSNLAH